ncbi:hypothetical protein TWF718_007922 [Orbilia javanica]|uniref:Uncharacterized protein n=1 Tax=Orbilia javanica TaxID=47235 RepID=A0AAN8MW37_9PEZI
MFWEPTQTNGWRQDPRTRIEGLLELEIQRAAERIAERNTRRNGLTDDRDLLTDSGNLITYVLELLGEVTATILRGDSMREYIDRKLEEEDMIGLKVANSLSERHAALTEICERLRATSADSNRIWERARVSPAPTRTPRNTYYPSSLEQRGNPILPDHRYQGSIPESFSHTIRNPRQELSQLVNYPRSRKPESYYQYRRGQRLQGSSDTAEIEYNREDDCYVNVEEDSDDEDSDDGSYGGDGYCEEHEDAQGSPAGEKEEGGYISAHSRIHRKMSIDDSATTYQVERRVASASTSASSRNPYNTDTNLDLERRGTGNYTCEFGFDCRKGGVNSNGDLVVFRRNSEFR